MPFTEGQNKLLDESLPGDWVKTRKQAGLTLSYVEGWRMIEQANYMFGFDGWSRETIIINMLGQYQCEIGATKKQGWNVSYMAKVRIEAGGVVREGTGVGHGIDVNAGQAHESAIKEAETDAMKRALTTFGHRFGLALYDKEKANVDYGEPVASPPHPHSIPTEPPSPSPPPDYRRGLLYANTIAELLSAWKAIPPHLQFNYIDLKDQRKEAILREQSAKDMEGH